MITSFISRWLASSLIIASVLLFAGGAVAPLTANAAGPGEACSRVDDPPGLCEDKGYFCEVPAGVTEGICKCAFGDFEAPIPGGPTGDVCKYTSGQGENPLLGYASFFANTIIALTVAAGIVMVVVGGYIYMTAGGSATRIGTAKSFIGMALLGIAIALTAYIILDTVSPQFASEVKEPKLSTPTPTP
ncbi:hypothetical protein CL628_00180 [bacterium]|nr:hypothetical protein [bacterium]